MILNEDDNRTVSDAHKYFCGNMICVSFQDDMHMVIRKWLSSTVPNHKQMGIIGAVSMIGSVALKRWEKM